MQFDFDKRFERRNTNSLKWDVTDSELPMWVADMDFQTAPAILKTLKKKVEGGIFGYSVVSEEWYEAILNWWSRRHGLFIQKEWLHFCTGVVPAVTCTVKRMTNIGDNVLVQTPVYDIFFHSIENHGRHVLENRLKYDGKQYEIDFEDLEEKLANPLTTMMILCNPHNPVGKIWNRNELERIGDLCKKYHVIILSDEIHCDLTDPNCAYTPFVSVSDICKEISITCISATKAFNLAGLQTAAVMIPNETIHNIMIRGLNADEIAEPNAFAIDAVVEAFNESEVWLDELREYLFQNKRFVEKFLEKELPQIRLISSKATYLLWLDCTKVLGDTKELCEFIRKQTGLYLSAGDQYRGNGTQFLRMNIACPRIVLEDGMERFKKGVEAYEEWAINQC